MLCLILDLLKVSARAKDEPVYVRNISLAQLRPNPEPGKPTANHSTHIQLPIHGCIHFDVATASFIYTYCI